MVFLEVPQNYVQHQGSGCHIDHARVCHQLADADGLASHSAEERSEP